QPRLCAPTDLPTDARRISRRLAPLPHASRGHHRRGGGRASRPKLFDHTPPPGGIRNPVRGRIRVSIGHLTHLPRTARHTGVADAPLGAHRIVRPAGAIWEFPGTVWRGLGYPLPVGGGGYFRLYPYLLTRIGLGAINRANRPFVAYLHPWELDPEQPRMRPGR